MSRRDLVSLVLRGDARVGKSCLLSQYASKQFQEEYKATIGSDFLTKDVDMGDRSVCVQLWDTAGQDRFQSLGIAFLKGAEVCVLVFAVNDEKSFRRLEHWREDFIKHRGEEAKDNFPFVVIGNKIDDGKRSVSTAEAQGWCDRNGCRYFEVSAKDGTGVDEALNTAAKLAHPFAPTLPTVSQVQSERGDEVLPEKKKSWFFIRWPLNFLRWLASFIW